MGSNPIAPKQRAHMTRIEKLQAAIESLKKPKLTVIEQDRIKSLLKEILEETTTKQNADLDAAWAEHDARRYY